MKTLIIKVEGMVCNGCENRVKNVLNSIDGIEKVEADYRKGQVIIEANSEIDENVIYEKIEDLGFNVLKEK